MAVRLLLRWPLFCLLTVWAVRFGETIELKDELDSLLCPTMEEKRGMIIDVHKSLDLGAKLLDGSWAPTLDQCVSECCRRKGCDLALFKNDGLSQSGKNCYYIECVSLDNCVMVEHSGFTSVVLIVQDSNTVPDTNNKDDRTGHNPPMTSSSPNTQAPPTSVASKNKERSSTSSGGDSPSSSPPSAESGSSTEPNSDGGRVSSSSEAPPTTPAAGSTEKAVEAVGVNDKSVLNAEGKGQGGVGVDDCGSHGCDGSGLIAIAVVGSICFVIIVLVVAVLLKKVISDNRRRKFNNVDYLINGMYT